MIGLTSQEAQKRLYAQLSRLINSKISIRWMKEARKHPCRMISNAMTATAGLLLVVEFCLVPDGRGSWHILFQALVLLFLAAFNISLLGWEVYMLKTQKVRHLLGRLGSALEIVFPWTPSDYPKSAISTLRGPLTTAAYRDKVLLNVPISLLVDGDVIEIEPGMPSPATAVLIDERESYGPVRVKAGEILPEALFKVKNTGDIDSYRFLPEVKSLKFMVEETPILAHLESSMQKTNPPSFLSREVKLMVCVATSLSTVFYAIALVFNLLRYFLLRNDFDNSWSELFFGIPIYTSLPLFLLHLPLVWSLINLFGTARIVLLVEKGPLYLAQASRKERLKAFFQTLRVMAELCCWCTHHPDIRLFHVLGRLTSVCAVDKEYLLTSEFPSPERVFFFRTEDVAPEEGCVATEETTHSSENAEQVLGGIQVNITSPRNFQIDKSNKSDFSTKEEEGCREGKFNRLQVTPQMDSISAGSVVSDPTPFELVMEILDISPDPSTYSGLAFDDVNWPYHISSLKPIGVNLLATSHMSHASFEFSCLSNSGELRQHLHKCCCSCSLGMEIGVTEFFCNKFRTRFVLTSVSSSTDKDDKRSATRKSTPTFMPSGNSHMPQHVISMVISSLETDKALVMSRGSGNMIVQCCSDFWDGKDLQPLTDTERQSIVNYYNSRSLSSYCVALAYNPMVDFKESRFPQKEAGVFVPLSDIETVQSDHSVSSMAEEVSDGINISQTAEQLFKNVQCNQVFLGLLSLQYRPKQDIISLVEDLYTTGIRFVHFTAENEVRAKIFAQKLGLEVDWNCYISLAKTSHSTAKDVQPSEDAAAHSDEEEDANDNDNSVASSMLSIYQATMSHIRARLPTGIENIRPHIEKVDNVPLLVSLFTECSSDTIREMLEIMQENSEVILCIGNAWNHENIGIFSQADIGVSLIPQHVDLHTCAVTTTCPLSTSNSSQNNCHGSSTSYKLFPSPLELASYINSAPCHLCFGRDNEVGLVSLVCESRRLLAAIRLSLIFGMGVSFSLSVLMVLSCVFFLPPPLSGSHLFWLITVIIPVVMLSFIATPLDPKIKSHMPVKWKTAVPDLWPVILEFLLFGVTGFYGLVLFALNLWQICNRDIRDASCHFLLGNRNANVTADWNGWRGDSEQGLLFAQDFVAFLMTVFFSAMSVRYIHRTRPLWQLWMFVSWQYLVAVGGAIILQLLYFAISQSVIGAQHVVVSRLSSVPASVWCLAILWPIVIILLMELIKYIDKRKFKKSQTLLLLQFGTKLGMHSPI